MLTKFWSAGHPTIVTIVFGVGFLLIIALGLQRAHAYSVAGGGCRFDPDNDDDGLGVAFDSTNFDQSRRDATEFAAGRWNTMTTPQFTLVSYGCSTRDVRVDFAYYGSSQDSAYTLRWCSSGPNRYSQDPVIVWNLDRWISSSDDAIGIGIHERGHAYGLDHNQNVLCSGSVAGLMYSPPSYKVDNCGWVWPTADHAAGQADAHY